MWFISRLITRFSLIFLLLFSVINNRSNLFDIIDKALNSNKNIEIEVKADDKKEEKQEIDETKYGSELVKLEGEVNTLSKYELPKVGNSLSGFRVKAIYDFKERNAKVVDFEHIKTGARAVLISNDDEDKSFCFSFKVAAHNDKGIPHVFEHSVLGGSEKYPSTSLFFEMINKTYNTYLNAFTLQNSNGYPAGSLSDEQLFSYFDFYADGVFNPNILRDKKNLDKEAYRYVYRNKGDDFLITGAVFNEMKGYEADENIAHIDNIKRTAFGKSINSNSSGGVSSEIIKISHDELIDFHKKYYHPSNLLLTLYGDIDYKKYLEYINSEYLSKYEKKEIKIIDDSKITTAFTEKKYYFPVASISETKNNCRYTYAIKCDDMKPYDFAMIELILSEFDMDSSPLRINIQNEMPNAGFDINFEVDALVPLVTFNFTNVNEDDDEKIKSIVEKSINEFIDKGIDEDTVKMYINDTKINSELTRDSHGFCDDYTEYNILNLNFGSEFGYLEYLKGRNEIEKNYTDGKISVILNKYFKEKNNSSLTGTIPKPGLYEKENEEYIKMLKERKNKMSDNELNELIKENKIYDDWVIENTSNSMVYKFRVASVSNLPLTTIKAYSYDENRSGIRFLSSNIEDIIYNKTTILFDLSHVKYDDLLKLSFLIDILEEMPTTNYTYSDLRSKIYKKSYYSRIGLDINYFDDGGYNPYLGVEFLCLDSNFSDLWTYLKERLLNTKFTDLNKLKNKAELYISNIKNEYLSSPFDLNRSIMQAVNNKDYLYEYHLTKFDYLKFLEEIKNMNDIELKNLATELDVIYKKIINSNNMVCEIIGNQNTINTIENAVVSFSDDIPYNRYEKQDYTKYLSLVATKSAIVVDGNVQYNLTFVPTKDIGIDFNGKIEVLSNIIDGDILYNELRFKNGAYSAHSVFDKKYMAMYSYKDPNLKETYNIYKDMPRLYKNININEEILENYKLKAYSKYSYPCTKLDAAITSINETLSEVSEKRFDRINRYLSEIKDMKVSDLKDLSKIIDIISKNERISTCGNKDKIEENKEMFDEIIYDLVR